MSLSSGHLDGLVGASFPVANYGDLAVASFTATVGVSPTLLGAEASATGTSGPLGLGLAGEKITVASVNDLNNSINVVFSYDAGTLPHEFTEYVLGFAPGGLLVSAFDPGTAADLLESGVNVDGDFGVLSSTPVVAGTSITFSAAAAFTDSVPCFAAGTRIATPRGEVAVEDLMAGDQVLTVFKGLAEVQWVGRSRVDCRRGPDPGAIAPVRIRAGAFAVGVPSRDVLLSPGHAVFAQGVLIPVHRLVNEVTIQREEAAGEVTYFHVEVEPHDVLLAEGLPAESYLDDGNRAALAGGAVHRMLRVDGEMRSGEAQSGKTRSWDDACAPKRESGPEVVAVRKQLRARLEELGYRRCDGTVELWAGEMRLPVKFQRGRLRHFLLPPRTCEVRLRSPRGIPAGGAGGTEDGRSLGARLALVLLDGDLVPLDSPVLAEGFYGLEQNARGSWRWTDGNGLLRLPASPEPRLLELLVSDTMGGWQLSLQPRPAPEWQAAA